MTAIALRIVQPVDGAVLPGATVVDLIGRVDTALVAHDGPNLFYRWYSSLFPSALNRYSINATALASPATPLSAALGVGSQVISLAVTDRPGETSADQVATRHGGVTGGAEGPQRCIIHVLRANLVAPLAGATLSRAGSQLDAEAPLHWARLDPATSAVTLNPDYHAINRLRYRWTFTPVGAPAGRRAATLAPAPAQLTYLPPGGPVTIARVRYSGPLPAPIDLGGYQLTLRVELIDDAAVGHEVARPVAIAP